MEEELSQKRAMYEARLAERMALIEERRLKQEQRATKDIEKVKDDIFEMSNPMLQQRNAVKPAAAPKPPGPKPPAPKPPAPKPPAPKPPVPAPAAVPSKPVKYGLKKTLLIGINYVQDSQNTLHGCINDVLNIRNKLVAVYPQCQTHKVLTDTDSNLANKPTRANILAGIQWLLSDLVEGDAIYMHYSGHGGLVRDLNGDEASGQDSCIYPINNGNIEYITDDELRAALVDKIPAGVKAFVVFDCCHSGRALDLRYNYVSPTRGTVIMSQNNKYVKTPGSIVYLSGCRDNQTAADTVDLQGKPSGALTNALLAVWNTYGVNIQFKYLLWDILHNLSANGYTQAPQLSCGSDIDLNAVFSLG
jgi:hypothetical protein